MLVGKCVGVGWLCLFMVLHSSAVEVRLSLRNSHYAMTHFALHIGRLCGNTSFTFPGHLSLAFCFLMLRKVMSELLIERLVLGRVGGRVTFYIPIELKG